MPLYDFKCFECENVFEAMLSLKDKDAGKKPSCPSCSSPKVEQTFRPIGYLKKDNCSPSSSGFG